ncbi:MAG: hypothetical protein [Bacteriophage sp.]|nr:MAG: hypothetical protein [Bacteriophage sp.]
MESLIVLQQQPCNRSCVSTSIAMILGLPAKVVIDRWDEEYHRDGVSLRTILDHYKIPFKSFDTADRNGMADCPSGYYLVTVPSLNFIGGNHEIVVALDNEKCLYMAYDPQQGTGAKYYTSNAEITDGLGVHITGGYTLDVCITPEDLKEWRKQNFIGE